MLDQVNQQEKTPTAPTPETQATAAPGEMTMPKKNTQARVGMLLGVGQQTVSDWLIHNTGAGNTHKPKRTEKPDARTTLTKEVSP